MGTYVLAASVGDGGRRASSSAILSFLSTRTRWDLQCPITQAPHVSQHPPHEVHLSLSDERLSRDLMDHGRRGADSKIVSNVEVPAYSHSEIAYNVEVIILTRQRVRPCEQSPRRAVP
jgi:hypothetical protein